MESTVNERFAMLIKHMGITQIEVAKQLETTHTTVNRWLNDHSTIRKNNAKAICQTFNVNFDWLMEGEGEMFNEGGAKIEKKQGGWRDEAYTKLEEYNESLKAEVAFLKSIVSGLLPVQKSFNLGTDVAGFLPQKLFSSVRVSA